MPGAAPSTSEKKFKILLVEGIHPLAKTTLEERGFHVDLEGASPAPEVLSQKLKSYDLLGIRSKTQITSQILNANPHLLGIGAFCIGTNQIDLKVANKLGMPVFNAPYSNTRSVAELVIAEMIALSRQLGDRNTEVHQGVWTKSAKSCFEIRGKILGIIGYGHIGSQLSVLAESMGMKVIFYDVVKKLPLGNARPVDSMAELLKSADFVSLHVPETPQTYEMMGAQELKWMKKGSYLINASRGTVVVIDALVAALKSEHLFGAAVDVYPQEPSDNKEKFVSPLQGLRNVILTPHVGGSTEEAQQAIGVEVAQSFIRFLENGSSSGAVNFPNVDLPIMRETHRLLNVHHNVPGVLGEINGIVSSVGANIQAQYLSTDADIGYLVMDMAKGQPDQIIERIQKLKTSIRTRIVY